MKEDYLKKLLEGETLSIFEQREDLEEEHEGVDYIIEDGKLFTWDGRDVMDLKEIDYDVYEEYLEDYDEEYEEYAGGLESWFKWTIKRIISIVWERDLPGKYEFEEWFDNDWQVGAMLQDKDGNLLEEENNILISDFI